MESDDRPEQEPESEAEPESEPEPESDAPTLLRADEAGGEVDPDAPLVGRLVGERYRVVELIGRGGMGAVYRAEHIHMKKPVALKVLHRALTSQFEIVARFEREAISAGRIQHPRIAAASDFGRLEDGSFYLILEYVQGTSLAELLAGGPLPEDRATRIARQITDGLAAAHSDGVVHRDLKPENVMLVQRPGEPEFVKILDFGLAKVLVDEDQGDTGHGPVLTRMGVVFGTPQYMAPEQAAGEAVDQRADLYTVGVMLYEMLVGYAPFRDEDVGTVLTMQMKTEPPPLPDWVDPELSAIVMQQLSKDPAERIQTAEELRTCFEAVLERIAPRPMLSSVSIEAGVPRSEAPTEHSHEAESPRRRLAPRVVWGVGLAIALLIPVALMLRHKPRAARLAAPTPSAPGPASAASVPGAPAVSGSLGSNPKLAELIARASMGDHDALEALEARDPRKRSAGEWLALGRGRMQVDREKAALAAYEKALDLDPSLSKDETLLRHVRRAAAHDETAAEALRIAAIRLGSAGADILYSVWVSTKAKTPTTQLAKQLVYSPDVLRKASPALGVALALRKASTCEDYKKLLPRATLSGDTRAYRILAPLQVKNGCGPGKKDDCYPCLRGSSALDDALSACRGHREPIY